MAIQTLELALPPLTRYSPKASQYDFRSLEAGTTQCVAESGLTEADVDKAHSRLTSAVQAYRKRSGDNRKFTVRTVDHKDGTFTVGVWCLGIVEKKVKADTAAATGEAAPAADQAAV